MIHSPQLFSHLLRMSIRARDVRTLIFYREHVLKKKTLGMPVFRREHFTLAGKFHKEHFLTFLTPFFDMYLNLNNSRKQHDIAGG